MSGDALTGFQLQNLGHTHKTQLLCVHNYAMHSLERVFRKTMKTVHSQNYAWMDLSMLLKKQNEHKTSVNQFNRPCFSIRVLQ